MAHLPADLHAAIVNLCTPLFRTEQDRDARLLDVLRAWPDNDLVIWEGDARAFTNRLVTVLPAGYVKTMLWQLVNLDNLPTERVRELCRQLDAAPAPDPLRAARERYLTWVYKTYSRLDLRGVEERQQKIHRLTLADVYVSLRATLDTADEAEKAGRAGRAQPEREARPLDMRELLGRSPRLAITGGPGCGKTTYLYVMAAALAQAWLSGDDSQVRAQLGLKGPLPIPFLVTLSEFNRYRRSPNNQADPAHGTLRGFLNYQARRQVRGLPDDFLDQLLDGGTPVMALLDGLDEVADDDERALVSQAVQTLLDNGEIAYLLVTSRTRAYRGQARLADLRLAAVQPLTPEQMAQLVGRWCAAVYDDENEREREQASLQREIEGLEARRQARGEAPLVDTPLMVTVVAIVHYDNRHLPEERAALYAKCVDVLLADRHHRPREGEEELRGWGGNVNTKRQFLAALAYRMMTAGEKAGRSVEDRQLRVWLQPEFEREYGAETARARLREFEAALRSRESILKEVDRQYSFVHLTFQEFLAAYHLAKTVREEEKIIAALLAGEQAAQAWWRETILLTLGYVGLDSKATALGLVRRLAGAGGSDEVQLAAAELAATAFLELESADAATRRWLHERLVGLLTTPGLSLQPSTRGLAGRALGQLEDERAGVGWVIRSGIKIPDIVWGGVVPAGKYTIGDDRYSDQQIRRIKIDQPYQLARYPVTYAQFQCFVEAADGADERWWAGMPTKDRYGPVRDLAEQAYKFDNHPRENVSWYQAIAFCRWLSDKLGDDVYLPTEYEWEVAARYPDGRVYPWGDDFDAAQANTRESGIRQTLAVGIFPDGANPALGLYDLSGNVWEWCRNKYDDPADDRVDHSGATRTLRGGSWFGVHDDARAACRGWSGPDGRSSDFGFRVARRPPSHPL